jgi:transcriptional regulator with XRE-family HTH domain
MIYQLITRTSCRLTENAGLQREDAALNPQPEAGQVVKSVRKRLGLTQQELAGRLGVALPTVSRWETKRHRPSRLALDKIEAFLQDMGEEGEALLEEYFNKTVPEKE